MTPNVIILLRMDDQLNMRMPIKKRRAGGKFTFIDLFAGIGGIRIAFENAGGECVFSSEWDKDCQKTYYANFGEIPKGDITKINTDEIEKFDILTGGFPCQPFSSIGKREGFLHKTQGTLFYDVLRNEEPRSKLTGYLAVNLFHTQRM